MIELNLFDYIIRFNAILLSIAIIIAAALILYLRHLHKQGFSYQEIAIAVIKDGAEIVSKLYRWGKEQIVLYMRRNNVFPIYNISLVEYTEKIEGKLHLCEECKLYPFLPDRDFVRFQIQLNVMNSFVSVDEIKKLLSDELQEHYTNKTPLNMCPLVYLVSFEKNIATFWIATNEQGNVIIREKMYADYYNTKSNEEDIVVD